MEKIGKESEKKPKNNWRTGNGKRTEREREREGKKMKRKIPSYKHRMAVPVAVAGCTDIANAKHDGAHCAIKALFSTPGILDSGTWNSEPSGLFISPLLPFVLIRFQAHF